MAFSLMEALTACLVQHHVQHAALQQQPALVAQQTTLSARILVHAHQASLLTEEEIACLVQLHVQHAALRRQPALDAQPTTP